MNRSPVASSSIKSVGYDNGVLEVEYARGKVYRYEGITPELHAQLMAAPSIGAFVQSQIKTQCTSCRAAGEHDHGQE